MSWRRAWMVAWLGGCGTETGNPELLSLSFNARSTDPAVTVGDGDEGTAVASVWLRLGPVRLTGDCDGDRVRTTVDALGFADHAHPEPAVQEVPILAATVCEVQTSFEVDEGATGEPAPVAGTSVALIGTLEDGRGFQVLVREPVALQWALDDEPIPAEGSWLVSFDLATWLDPDEIAALPGDEVVVSAEDHVDVYAGVLDRLAAGVQLHHDADGDGQVGPGDRQLD